MRQHVSAYVSLRQHAKKRKRKRKTGAPQQMPQMPRVPEKHPQPPHRMLPKRKRKTNTLPPSASAAVIIFPQAGVHAALSY